MSLLDGPHAPRTVSIDITFLVRQALGVERGDTTGAVDEPSPPVAAAPAPVTRGAIG